MPQQSHMQLLILSYLEFILADLNMSLYVGKLGAC